MPLTDTSIRAAKPTDKTQRFFDGGGLYLELSPSGGKWWRFKYRFDGKEKRISFGVYPATGLKDAREKRDAARKLLANDIDPSENRKAQKAARDNATSNSFEVIAREWHLKKSATWSESYAKKTITRFEQDLFPWIGKRPISEIAAPELLASLRRIEKRGAIETAHRALGECGQVLRYAIATGRAERDISSDLRGALTPAKPTHLAAITEPKQAAELLRALDGYQGTFVVSCALRLAPLVFVRPGELRKAEWADINLETAEWRYQVTKTDTAHIVPLAHQAVTILEELRPLTGSGRYVFPGARTPDRPMSDNAILAAMRRTGIDKEAMSGHGFRAMARTILDEVLGVRVDFIEHQLAHAVKDPNGRAYNRTAHLAERRKMMQLWADYLDKIKTGAEVVQLRTGTDSATGESHPSWGEFS
jgi:integrase